MKLAARGGLPGLHECGAMSFTDADEDLDSRSIELVMKTSKYCNLRCSYCYEYNDLGNRRRMSLDSLAVFLGHIKDWIIGQNIGHADFIWHGGEPLLLPLEFHMDVHKLQKTILAEVPFGIVNATQTNLTVLSDRQIEYLKTDGLFGSLGVSFDVFGDERVDVKGRSRTEIILRNMQRLIDNKIEFAAISVLARHTLGREVDIYRFYDRLGIESRLLPFHLSSFDGQVDRHGLTNPEIVGAFKAVFGEWLTSERATAIEPIAKYVSIAVAELSDAPRRVYDKRRDENVFIINVDGGVWGDETYNPSYCYGNAFEQPFDVILASKARARALVEAEERQSRYCYACPHFGYCNGAFVADATPQERNGLERWGCYVREMIEHISDTLKRSELRDKIVNFRPKSQQQSLNPG